jgi:hypothetical protein
MNSKIWHLRHLSILLLILYSALVMLFWCIQCPGQNKDKLSALKACETLFGNPIDFNSKLFKINSDFVLQVRFDTGNLISLRIVPKYYLNDMHPEWTEPDEWPLLSKSEFQRLLNQLDNIIPRGKLVERQTLCIVSNSTCSLLDKYKNAYMQKWQTGDDIRSFELYPFHEIEGKVIKKEILKYRESKRGPEKAICRVLIGELIYDIEPREYAKLHEGRVQKFLGVGPIEGTCLAGHCNK